MLLTHLLYEIVLPKIGINSFILLSYCSLKFSLGEVSVSLMDRGLLGLSIPSKSLFLSSIL